ncbi:gag-pol polyprotein precursor [Lasius niger]|uniref:Gag-pol polyprotein n=1 Tax=Lasius niger TaxID=67767 RepID=A0A0J7KGI8_LASNI|nr:gag-pol polyprotein precursor [Lasius niger]
MSTFGSIVEKQHHLFGLIARAYHNAKKLGGEKLTKVALETRLHTLEANWDKFQGNHDKVLCVMTDDLRHHPYFKDDLYTQCEEAFYDSKTSLVEDIEKVTTSKDDNHEYNQRHSHSGSCRSLPKISLPKFSGDYHDWPSFRDLFDSMVGSNRDISSVEKLHYLRAQTTGEAARYLANIPVTAANFARAWKALTSRYENRRILVTTYLDKIFALKPLAQKSSSDLKILLSTVKESLGALNSLGAPTDQWDILIVYVVTRRLDAHTLEAWELEQGTSNELATFDELELFLEGRIRALETVQSRSTQSNTAAASHYISACSEFAGKSLGERQEFVTKKNLCFNCLGSHRLAECRTLKRCRHCKGQHHSLLHREVASSTAALATADSPTTSSASSSSTPSSAVVHSHHAAIQVNRPQVLLATACMTLVAARGEDVKVRALLDQGSEVSLIQESLVQLLRLPRSRASVPIVSVGSQKVGSTRGVVSLRLRSFINPSFEVDVTAFILPRVTGRIPAQRVASTSWSHLVDLPLADPDFAVPGSIDVILGADVYGSLLCGDIRRGPSDAPIAQETSFGWIISGPTGSSASAFHPTSYTIRANDGVDLNEIVQRFWLQEEVSTSSISPFTPDELECENHFRDTHSRDRTGRYVVRLPFRSSHAPLGESRSAALRLLTTVQSRILRNPSFGDLYIGFMKEYETLGHMRRASPADSAVYLPHHGVLRASSTTTKLRVVFNGSARTTSGSALNDCLHAGPKLQHDLDAVLLRWRTHAFVFAADIIKMYRQILVHQKDQDFQRILWSESGEPHDFKLTTVTYGLTCAPYLALRVIQQLASDEEKTFPQAAEILRRETYVDDILSGADTPHEAQRKALQLVQLLRAGGFELQKWAANDASIISSFAKSDDHSLSRDLPNEARTLGLTWHPNADVFKFHVSQSDHPRPITKRSALSRIAQVFDPLGWLAPVTIVGKIFIQQLWKTQVGWDDPLPPSLAGEWVTFDEQLKHVSALSIPRWICTSPSVSGMELHGFSDASQDALGAVLYLRSFHDYADANIILLAAKSKVAPVKRQTIPRLELSAAVLLARLLARIRDILEFKHVPVHLWTDSTISLAWIKGHPSTWKEFVGNRVTAVQELAPDARWHHVAGTDNPADCLSRGLTPQQLQHHRLWWHGPSWLKGPSVGWPSGGPPLDQSADLEQRTQKPALVNLVSAPSDCWDLIHRFSQLQSLLRTTAWLMRATARFRGRECPSSSTLTADEILRARTFWLKETQRTYFGGTLELCAQGTALPRSHPLLKLAPFVDYEGILRVGGRLKNSSLDADTKHPAILPRDSSFSRLLISEIHKQTLHGGVQLVLATLRQQFWILGGRSPVSAFIRRCVRCARYRATTAKEMMGSLPASRVTPTRPFLNSGVDYAGPFSLRTWRGRAGRTYKGYLIVFICFATSAVHLELATDYSTQGFLAAYRRFTGRRGRCNTLISDCGTNFVGADAELRRMFSSASKEAADLAHILAADGTTWRFNPPSAPHFGGKWEAAVKSTKFHLRRILGDSILTYEEFNTLLVQIEAVLNSRPLCALSDDPADVIALTPAHFLVGESLTTIPEPSVVETPISRLSRWQLIRHMLERFWHRWSTEYLQRLQTRTKWHQSSNPISIGSLVLVSDERFPPSKWPLARVTEIHPGNDGKIRVVTVRTAASTFKRPIVKLCPLPIEATNL